MKKVKYVCGKCGSEDIKFDAYATWNVEKQEMELLTTFDKGHVCEGDCDGEECDVVEVEIEDESNYFERQMRIREQDQMDNRSPLDSDINPSY